MTHPVDTDVLLSELAARVLFSKTAKREELIRYGLEQAHRNRAPCTVFLDEFTPDGVGQRVDIPAPDDSSGH